MLDGSTITAVFKAQEPLAAVRVYVQMNGNTPEGQDFTLLSPYPRHVYTELDMEKPLKELGKHWSTEQFWNSISRPRAHVHTSINVVYYTDVIFLF